MPESDVGIMKLISLYRRSNKTAEYPANKLMDNWRFFIVATREEYFSAVLYQQNVIHTI